MTGSKESERILKLSNIPNKETGLTSMTRSVNLKICYDRQTDRFDLVNLKLSIFVLEAGRFVTALLFFLFLISKSFLTALTERNGWKCSDKKISSTNFSFSLYNLAF